MGTNWIAPSANDIAKVIALNVMATSNENVDADTVAAALQDPEKRRTLDPSIDDRATEIVSLVVAQFRGAIQVAGKYPLSCTAATVPPEVYKHVLNMAAWELAMSTPSLKMFILSETGASAPFATFYTEAKACVEALTKGRSIVLPTDPTGCDYINSINVPWASPYPVYVPANPINFQWRGCGASPYGVYDPTKPINVPWSSRFPAFVPTMPINKPLDPIRVGASSPPSDMNSWQGYFGQEPPCGWPLGELGFP